MTSISSKIPTVFDQIFSIEKFDFETELPSALKGSSNPNRPISAMYYQKKSRVVHGITLDPSNPKDYVKILTDKGDTIDFPLKNDTVEKVKPTNRFYSSEEEVDSVIEELISEEQERLEEIKSWISKQESMLRDMVVNKKF